MEGKEKRAEADSEMTFWDPSLRPLGPLPPPRQTMRKLSVEDPGPLHKSQVTTHLPGLWIGVGTVHLGWGAHARS